MTCDTESPCPVVLIVEPNEKVREIFQKFINGMGWEGIGLHPSQLDGWVSCQDALHVRAQVIDIGISPDPVQMSLIHLVQLWNGRMPFTIFIGTNPVIIDCLKRRGYMALLKPFSLSTLRDILLFSSAGSEAVIQTTHCLPEVSVSLH